jgi:protein phosphatase
MKLRFAATSNAGNRPGVNEDHIGWNEAAGLWVIADGMGGHAAGEVASRITVESTLQWAVEFRLADSLLKAHEAVVAAAGAEQRHGGMGSTVVAFRRRDGAAEIGWVGDSRAYLWRGGKLVQLTRDHSLTQALADRLGSDADLPDQRILVQAIGMDNPKPDVLVQPMRAGDRFLLATDGLTTEVTDAQIGQVLRAAADPQATVDALLAAALAHGGGDNVSIIVIEAAGHWYEGRDWQVPVLAGAGLAIAGFLLWLLL